MTTLAHDTPDLFLWLKVNGEPTGDSNVIVPPEMEVVEHYPEVPGHRPNAPETSKQAEPSRGRDAETKRKIIKLLSLRSYTSDELAAEIGESILYVRPRVSQLRALARITDSGIRRINQSGQSACVWRLA